MIYMAESIYALLAEVLVHPQPKFPAWVVCHTHHI